MPRGQYTRKPAAAKAAEDQAPDPEVEDTTKEPDVDTVASATGDAAEANDSEANVPSDAAGDGDTSPAPEADNGTVSADSPDNVLYPVDNNPAAQPGPLCPACFPVGWPAGAEQAVGCEHGLWIRQWPPAVQDGN